MVLKLQIEWSFSQGLECPSAKCISYLVSQHRVFSMGENFRDIESGNVLVEAFDVCNDFFEMGRIYVISINEEIKHHLTVGNNEKCGQLASDCIKEGSF